MPAVSIARGSAPIFTCVAVSGTCLTATRIFITSPSKMSPLASDGRACGSAGVLPLALLVMELPGDPEAIAGDEHAIEDDGRAARVVGHALGLERGRPGAAAELARLATAEAHRRHRLARALDRDAQLELEHLVERRARQVGADDLLADRRREERALEAYRVAVHQAEPLEREHARARPEPERAGDTVVGHEELRPDQARRHVLALGLEVAGEPAELQDVVVDGGRRDERPEAVTARDQVLALEQLERLPQRHQRHAEALREPSLVVEPGAGPERALTDPRAKRLGDPVVARDPRVGPAVPVRPHPDPLGVLEHQRAARIAESAGTGNGGERAAPAGTWGAPRRPILGPRDGRAQGRPPTRTRAR